MNRPVLSAAFTAVLLLAACDSTESPGATPSFATEASTAPSATTPTSAGTPPATEAPKPKPSVSSKEATSGPKILSFEVKVKPSCPSRGDVFVNPGNPITLAWKVTGTDTVDVLIDGGLYYSYPASHVAEVPFSCEGPEGSTERHDYTLRATADGDTVEKTLPATARINIGS